MSRRFQWLLAAGVLQVLLVCPFPLSAQLSASGSEAVVNSLSGNSQTRPDIAMEPSGDYVIIYESDGHDSEGWGILGQRFFSNGSKRGAEFTANFSQVRDQRSPAVGVDAFGKFTVVYMSEVVDADGWGIKLSRYDSTGFPKGDTLVNTTELGEQRDPDLAVDYDGDMVVVWTNINFTGDSLTIRGQRIDSSGAFLGSEFQASTTLNNYAGFPKVATSYHGAFTVVWQASGQDGDGQGIFAQRYDSSGSALGTEFQVNTTTSANQQSPAIAMDSAGNFVVIWQSYNQDGDDYGIYGQRYAADGTSLGSEFLVNSTTSGAQEYPAITMAYGGAFVVSWTSHGQDGSNSGVYMKSYDASGSVLDDETRINSTTTNFQQFAAPCLNPTGTDLAVAWQDGQLNSAGLDGDDFGIIMLQFSTGGTPLPIELLSFDATKRTEESALITWTTATEVDNYGFVVQRLEGADPSGEWAELGFVEGAGFSNQPLEYEFIDHHPHDGINYYRLEQLDFDGTATFTEIRAVTFDGVGDLTVYPNPAREVLYVQRGGDSAEGQVPYRLYDSYGNLVLQGMLEGTRTAIPLNGLASGIYFLTGTEQDQGNHHKILITGR